MSGWFYLVFINKGEVEHIALLKPKAQTESEDGMLEFLEDIIGSSQFKEPIEQLSKRVEELNEARGEKVCFVAFFVESLKWKLKLMVMLTHNC